MRKASQTLLALVAVWIQLLITSCEHREFLYEPLSRRVPVEVEFDWSDAPFASPEGMTVYFFRDGATSPIAYDFKGRDGGSITLAPGIYSAICHNNDSDRHGFVGSSSYDDFGIRLNDNRNAGDLNGNSHIQPRDSNERIAHSPDSMWVATIPMFEIKESDILATASAKAKGDAQAIVLRFAMQKVVNHYTFIIHNPINFTNSIYVSATISGMAGTHHPGRGMNGDETVTHLFSMTPSADGGLIGEILTFGHCGGGSRADEGEPPHRFTVNAILANGSRWSSTHDVTDQIHNSPTPDCVVRIDSVAFPEQPGGEGGGFSTSVEGWTGTRETIVM